MAWAVSAKNTLQNHSGYSPNELVFGINIDTSSILTDQLLALEAATTSDIVRVNLNALHVVRKSFFKAESSKRIALRSNVRTYSDEGFVSGDNVYYRRQSCKGWNGPAKVLSKEGQCVLIRHGDIFYWIHAYHLMKVNKEWGSPRNVENKVSSNEINEVLEEEDERQHKSPHSKVRNWKMILKNHVEMQLWNIKWRGVKSRKKGKIMSTLSKSSGKYSHWLEYKTRIGKQKSNLYQLGSYWSMETSTPSNKQSKFSRTCCFTYV